MHCENRNGEEETKIFRMGRFAANELILSSSPDAKFDALGEKELANGSPLLVGPVRNIARNAVPANASGDDNISRDVRAKFRVNEGV